MQILGVGRDGDTTIQAQIDVDVTAAGLRLAGSKTQVSRHPDFAVESFLLEVAPAIRPGRNAAKPAAQAYSRRRFRRGRTAVLGRTVGL